jgi:PadR family transcriptional regulator PadR
LYFVAVLNEALEGKGAGGGLTQLRRELARGTAELAVLSVLSSDRRYGYEMLKLLRSAGAGVLELKEGTLYPLLHRLEDAGHITAEWETEGRQRPRKYYAIAASGRERLLLLRAEWSGLVGAVKGLLDSLDAMNHGGASSAETDAT